MKTVPATTGCANYRVSPSNRNGLLSGLAASQAHAVAPPACATDSLRRG